MRALGLLALLLAPVGAYASFVEPERLVVERAQLRLPAGRDGLIADLQFRSLGGHEREAVDRLLAQHPDVIVLAGDYHQGSQRSFAHELPGLRAPGGVFAVQGDTESMREARVVFAGTGVRLLDNELARVGVWDRRVTIGGVERSYRSGAAQALVRRLERGSGAGDVRLLLAHRPDVALGLRHDTRIDLVLAGHTHGGQLQLPGIGPLQTASHVPRRVAGGGLHDLSGRWVYVSRGVGVERAQAPRLRLGAPPEVSIITSR